jgi:protein-disulfide isomerase
MWTFIDRLATLTVLFTAATMIYVLAQRGSQPGTARQANGTASRSRPRPVETVHDVETMLGSTVKDNGTPHLAVIEFSDFECPYCGAFARDSFARLEKEFVETGKTAYSFRHLPFERLHKFAFKAAEAAECARRQGKFWELHHALFRQQSALSTIDLRNAGRAVGMEMARFDGCLGGEAVQAIRQDQSEATRLNIDSTPTILIGRLIGTAKVSVLRKINGAQPYSMIAATINELLVE